MSEEKPREYTKGVRSMHPDYIWGWNVGHTLKITKDMKGDERRSMALFEMDIIKKEGMEKNAEMSYLQQGFVDGYNTLVDEIDGRE
ncbi:MAG: hypothetical protein FWE16_03445 [Firmicutes bacterium]|nr:hypothetical protein [Bacillota bacterium]